MLYHFLLLMSLLASCNSYQQFHHISQEFEIPSRVFRANYGQTWQAALNVMKKYDLEVINQESGLLKTRWHNNTLEVNFADSFGGSDSVKSAKYKLILNISKGFQENREVAKVSLYKRQMVEQDFPAGLESHPQRRHYGKKILYRIQRVLFIERGTQKNPRRSHQRGGSARGLLRHFLISQLLQSRSKTEKGQIFLKPLYPNVDKGIGARKKCPVTTWFNHCEQYAHRSEN